MMAPVIADDAGRRGTVFSIDADIRSPGQGGRHAVIVGGDPGDDPQREILTRHLVGRGFHVSRAGNGLDALSVIGSQGPNLALLLRGEQDGDAGGRTVALAAMLYPHTRIIVVAGMEEAGMETDLGLPPDGGLIPVLRRPVDLNRFDRCLDGLIG